jgi:alternate F1F0 ATPase F1 subunit epsilon
MRLAVTAPLSIIIEVNDVAHLRAEDETGAFGILPRHADFLTALSVSVISWRDQAGAEHHLAVRGGVLEVRGGEAITVATRDRNKFCGAPCRASPWHRSVKLQTERRQCWAPPQPSVPLAWTPESSGD